MTKKQFKTILEAYKAQELKYIAEHLQIRAILLPLIGKPINGKTLNSKVLGDFKYSCEYGSLCYIKGEYTHLIGYSDSENTIAVEPIEGVSRGFDYFDNCHGGAAQERINQIDSLDFEKAYNIYSQIDKHFNKLRELFGDVERMKLGSYHFPPYYSVLNAIYKGEDSKDIKLTDFYFIRK